MGMGDMGGLLGVLGWEDVGCKVDLGVFWGGEGEWGRGGWEGGCEGGGGERGGSGSVG